MIFHKFLFSILLILPIASLAHGKSLVVEGELDRFDKEKGILIYNHPRVTFEQKTILGDKLQYNQKDKFLVFSGNIIIRMPELLLSADQVTYDIQSKVLTLTNATLFDKHSLAFIKASKIKTLNDSEFVVYDGSITTCKPDSRAWELNANYINYQVNHFAYANNTVLKFYRIPLFYTPFFSWPTKKGRASGLLPPSFTNQIGNLDYSKNYGKRLKIPYYLAIDKAQDLTLTADIIDKRGTGIEVEYRYAFLKDMLGEIRFWYLDESKEQRDLYHENLGDLERANDPFLPAEPLDLRPTRYKIEFDHKQNIFLSGRLFLQHHQYSDAELNSEYFDSELFGANRYYQRIDLIFPWKNGDINLGREIGNNFRHPSLYDTSPEYDTSTNKGSYINISHRSARILGSPLSLSMNGNSTNHIGEWGWKGKVNQFNAAFSAPIKIDFINVMPQLKRRYLNFDINYDKSNIDSKMLPLNFNAFPEPFAWYIDQRELELNFEIFRIFKNQKNLGKLSFQPRLIFSEINDVDQKQSIDFTTESLLTTKGLEEISADSTNSDYYKYKSIFVEPTLSRKSIEYRLDTVYLTKDPLTQKIRPFFKLELSQTFNLNRKGSKEETDQAFVGPQIPDNLNETSFGNKKMPFIINMTLSPISRFQASLFNRYDYEENRFVETVIKLSAVSPDESHYGLQYIKNTKSYIDLNGDEHQSKSRYSIYHFLKIGNRFDLYLRGEWDLNRNDLKIQYGSNKQIKRLNTQLFAAETKLYFKHDCYQFIAAYSEYSKYQWIKGVQTEYMDRKFTFTFLLEGWPDISNPYHREYLLQ